jgi:hypothetical protein
MSMKPRYAKPRGIAAAALLAVFGLAVSGGTTRAQFYETFPAPLGVMGDHSHETGELMLSYRFMRMAMNGNRGGFDDVSISRVLRDYMVAPERMTMEMHMFGAMYGVNDDLTLMAMLPYTRKWMDHVNRMGVEFTTASDGIGDVKLQALYELIDLDYELLPDRYMKQNLHLHFGFSVPTGDIDKKGDTALGPDRQLPYPMQLGSGTPDFRPGITYTTNFESITWGIQYMGTFRLGRNHRGYQLGDLHEVTSWGAYQWTDWLNTSFRLAYQNLGNIDGADSDLNIMLVPTADPDKRGMERLDALGSVDVIVPIPGIPENRIGVEFGRPIYQYVQGPQLETDWILTAGWQGTWRF